MDLSTVKKMVSALLDKTVERGCTEEEAAAAAQKAQELLMKHRLGMAELRGDSQDEEELVEESVMDTAMGQRRFSTWRGILGSAAAKANGCFVVIRHCPSRLVIFGTATNRDLATYMFKYLFQQVLYMSRLHASAAGRTAANNYRMGMVHTLYHRLMEANRVASVGASERALVIVKNDLERAQRAAGPVTKAGPANYRHDREYYDLGRKHGQQIALTRGLRQEKQRKQLS